jgi:ribose transport system substrate-binding protein
MRLLALLASCSVMASLLLGCGDSGSKPPTERTLRIAVIPKGTTSEYWKIVHAGAEKARQELAPTQKIEIIWKGSLKEDQSADEISVVEDMWNNKVDAIVLAPNDAKALADAVNKTADRKIPIVIIDSGVQTDRYNSFVATDNKKGGLMGGKELARLMNNKGNVIMLRYQEGSASTEEREAGFLEAARAAGLNPVDVDKHGGVTADSCQKIAENLLAAHTKNGVLDFEGIFCPNYPTTFGMLRALEDAKFAGKVKFVGFDSDVALAQALRDGKVNALVVQDPINMGYLGVKTAVQIVQGKTPLKLVDTGVHLVTSENVNSPESKEILTPSISQYLKE